MCLIGLLNLSDPLSHPIGSLVAFLEENGHQVYVSPYLYDQEATPQQKAELFNRWMRKNTFDYICDVSGGDLANTCIPYLDHEIYRKSRSLFMGYSDLTCVLNVLASDRPVLLYQIRNHGKEKEFLSFLEGGNDLVLYDEKMVGGNIRCFLKLAGTPSFPSVEKMTLFLESFSGNARRIESYFAQLAQIGVFEKIEKLILGNFSELLQSKSEQTLFKIASHYCKKPIYFDPRIGHQYDSYAILLGKKK